MIFPFSKVTFILSDPKWTVVARHRLWVAPISGLPLSRRAPCRLPVELDHLLCQLPVEFDLVSLWRQLPIEFDLVSLWLPVEPGLVWCRLPVELDLFSLPSGLRLHASLPSGTTQVVWCHLITVQIGVSVLGPSRSVVPKHGTNCTN